MAPRSALRRAYSAGCEGSKGPEVQEPAVRQAAGGSGLTAAGGDCRITIVCLRLFDEDAETCDDSGPWTLENGRVCFRMQWWGLADQTTSGCFRIVRTNGDGYQAIDDKGVLLFDFSIESEE